MPTKAEVIRTKAVELLKSNPDGLRYADLHRELVKQFPDIPLNTIQASAWDLHNTRSKEVYKPSRGLFKYRFAGVEESLPDTQPTEVEPTPVTFKEEDFYSPFADWIKNELGECTEAVPLGGNSLGKKWGTPDVIGVYKSSKRDVIQFQPEIVSAEIKIDPKDPITAFGQAISYRLFSSKVYLVEPTTLSPEDMDRIEALCILFGVGLILFDLTPANPNFRIRVRAQKYIPDMFYANELADRLYETNKKLFDKLF
ncbi:MAG: hypothetical protein KGZ85_15280 [Ignavibacterium sp.]|nr:hypothetical protein [Ignavibacterium sp.]